MTGIAALRSPKYVYVSPPVSWLLFKGAIRQQDASPTGAQSDPSAAALTGRARNGNDDSSTDGDGIRNNFRHLGEHDRRTAA
jgi:hypothetical protein